MPSGVDQPGNMLDQLVRDVEHGRMRNHQSPGLPAVSSGINTADDRGICCVTTPADRAL